MSEAALIDQVTLALGRESVLRRYYRHVHVESDARSPCRTWWIGALANRGHGRFWIGKSQVVIAHRFAYAIAFGVDALVDASVLSHSCDNPLCVDAEHLVPSTPAQNAREWALRHELWNGPLADARGSRQRAYAIRNGLRSGRALGELLEEGRTQLDRGQLPLW